jgi:hypothetical protein
MLGGGARGSGEGGEIRDAEGLAKGTVRATKKGREGIPSYTHLGSWAERGVGEAKLARETRGENLKGREADARVDEESSGGDPTCKKGSREREVERGQTHAAEVDWE